MSSSSLAFQLIISVVVSAHPHDDHPPNILEVETLQRGHNNVHDNTSSQLHATHANFNTSPHTPHTHTQQTHQTLAQHQHAMPSKSPCLLDSYAHPSSGNGTHARTPT